MSAARRVRCGRPLFEIAALAISAIGALAISAPGPLADTCCAPPAAAATQRADVLPQQHPAELPLEERPGRGLYPTYAGKRANRSHDRRKVTSFTTARGANDVPARSFRDRIDLVKMQTQLVVAVEIELRKLDHHGAHRKPPARLTRLFLGRQEATTSPNRLHQVKRQVAVETDCL